MDGTGPGVVLCYVTLPNWCLDGVGPDKAVNTLVQGTAADMMKTAMLRWLGAVSTTGGGVGVQRASVVAALDVLGAADAGRVRLVGTGERPIARDGIHPLR